MLSWTLKDKVQQQNKENITEISIHMLEDRRSSAHSSCFEIFLEDRVSDDFGQFRDCGGSNGEGPLPPGCCG